MPSASQDSRAETIEAKPSPSRGAEPEADSGMLVGKLSAGVVVMVEPAVSAAVSSLSEGGGSGVHSTLEAATVVVPRAATISTVVSVNTCAPPSVRAAF